LVILFALTVGVLTVLPLFAHHGGASILSGKTATLKGTVKAWLWSNPHCLLTFDVKGEDGKVVEWVGETQAPSSIYSSGYRKDSFKPGDVITITLEVVKSGAPNGRIARAVLADGTTLGGQAGGVGGDGARGGRGGADSY
jgi:hypothetical protein